MAIAYEVLHNCGDSVHQTSSVRAAIKWANNDTDCRLDGFEVWSVLPNRFDGELTLYRRVYFDYGSESEDESSFYDRMSYEQQREYDERNAFNDRLDAFYRER